MPALTSADWDFDKLSTLALEAPSLNRNPLPEYARADFSYGMTIGIEHTPEGRLWACWVGGGDNEKSYFILATSDDKGASWSEPRLVIDPHSPELPLARRALVGTLWLDPLGRLWLFFDQSFTHFDGRSGNWFTRCDNPDADEPQWTAPHRIWHGCTLNKPIALTSGEWLLPISLWDRNKITQPQFIQNLPSQDWARDPFRNAYADLDEWRMANVFASRDQGVTWERRGGVRFLSPMFDEHNLVELADGRLWMTARTAGPNGIWQSFSVDGGISWDEPTFYLEHCSSRHVIRRLPSGNLLLIKHGFPVNTQTSTRSHLTAYCSKDEGNTWQGGLILDEREAVSYPDVAITPNGQLFISYDYNRNTDGHILMARITENDILSGKITSPNSALRILIAQSNPAAVATRHAIESQSLPPELLLNRSKRQLK